MSADVPERERVAKLFGLRLDSPHYEQALTHPSYANEREGIDDNQRLEFLGDSVLGLCTSELLWERFPNAAEGSLTRMRAQLVNADALANFARRVDLSGALHLGRGADASGLRDSTNVLADAVEALIAAAYLDKGLDTAREACKRVVEPELERLQVTSGRDPKSELQERLQAHGGGPPSYQVVESGGPSHARWFVVEALHDDQAIGRGRGRSKRLAERAAAQEALDSGRWMDAMEEIVDDNG